MLAVPTLIIRSFRPTTARNNDFCDNTQQCLRHVSASIRGTIQCGRQVYKVVIVSNPTEDPMTSNASTGLGADTCIHARIKNGKAPKSEKRLSIRALGLAPNSRMTSLDARGMLNPCSVRCKVKAHRKRLKVTQLRIKK